MSAIKLAGIFLLGFMAIGAWKQPQPSQPQLPKSESITIKIVRDAVTGAIHVTDQDGRGLLFYRGLPEVQEYLAARLDFEPWEDRIRLALAATIKSDPTMQNKTETYDYYAASTAVKR